MSAAKGIRHQWTDRKCPRCGSTLLTDGRSLWCSFVGGGGERACSYGVDERVAAPAPDLEPCPMCKGARWIRMYTGPWSRPIHAPCIECNADGGAPHRSPKKVGPITWYRNAGEARVGDRVWVRAHGASYRKEGTIETVSPFTPSSDLLVVRTDDGCIYERTSGEVERCDGLATVDTSQPKNRNEQAFNPATD